MIDESENDDDTEKVDKEDNEVDDDAEKVDKKDDQVDGKQGNDKRNNCNKKKLFILQMLSFLINSVNISTVLMKLFHLNWVSLNSYLFIYFLLNMLVLVQLEKELYYDNINFRPTFTHQIFREK
jgi:hypothetical protein